MTFYPSWESEQMSHYYSDEVFLVHPGIAHIASFWIVLRLLSCAAERFKILKPYSITDMNIVFEREVLVFSDTAVHRPSSWVQQVSSFLASVLFMCTLLHEDAYQKWCQVIWCVVSCQDCCLFALMCTLLASNPTKWKHQILPIIIVSLLYQHGRDPEEIRAGRALQTGWMVRPVKSRIHLYKVGVVWWCLNNHVIKANIPAV